MDMQRSVGREAVAVETEGPFGGKVETPGRPGGAIKGEW
jgi:hypothetical protein